MHPSAAVRRAGLLCVMLLWALSVVAGNAGAAQRLQLKASFVDRTSASLDVQNCDGGPAVDSAAAADAGQVGGTLSFEIEQLRDATGIPSVSIVLLLNDDILWAKAFGYMNVRSQTPASTETIYCTGSCFKPITAMAAMQLVDEGVVDLDAPVNSYLGTNQIADRSDEGQPVTLRHLLSHYAGLPGDQFEMQPHWQRRLPRSLAALAAAVQVKSPPGDHFEYSNAGYALAGLVVEQMRGRPFEECIVEHILLPSGVACPGPVNPTPAMLEVLAFPYRLDGNTPVPEALHRFDVFPAGEIYLSAPDMGRVLLAHLNDGSRAGVSLLSETSVKEMRTPQFGGTSGLDFGIQQFEGDTLIMHAGGVPGYSSKFMLDVESRMGVYVVCNAGDAHMAMNYLSQLSIDLLRGREIGTGLIREIVGLGTALDVDEGQGLIQITDVFPLSPAHRAGIRRGQWIQKINQQPVAGKDIDECLQMMAGPAGTPVQLTVLDADGEHPQTYELTKASFRIPG